ncbi:hypothetical protein Pint_22837 [Pistacia integerrima]|uniref:Uncharacterized protein n=1 Tax=Pistacia integerrima TaxID=434235 RepID=A0ACC0YN34_9ROSI|nr:hypothetical protein Pint_22837 [Pistacia integerrima]
MKLSPWLPATNSMDTTISNGPNLW